jgi:hypothetical protein
LGYAFATDSTGQGDWQVALERFRRAEGLPLGGPLKPEDLARLTRRRFPHGCRLEVLVWPSGDPEAAASAPARDLVISADRPEALPASTLKLLLGSTEDPDQAGYNPERETTPPGDQVAGYWTRLSRACPAGCRLEVRLGPDETLARPAPAAKAVDLSLAEQVEGAYSHPARNFKPGDQVLAVEKVECSAKSGDWVLFYQGTVSEVGPQAVKVKLESRYSYRHRPNAQGVDPGDWWCVPRRRHCWSPVKFGDWGGQATPGQIKEFMPQVVFYGQEGVVNIMSLVVSDRCPN